MKKLEKLKEFDFPEEIEKEAIKLAAYYIIKELYTENLITENEFHFIRNRYEIPVE